MNRFKVCVCGCVVGQVCRWSLGRGLDRRGSHTITCVLYRKFTRKKKKIILHDIRYGIFVMFIRCYIMAYAEFLKGTIEKISLSINEPKLKKNSIH